MLVYMCVYVIRLATPWHRTGSFPHRRISLASECARLTREYIYIYVGPCVCTCVRLNALNHRLHLTRAVCVVPIRSDRTDLARAQMCSHGCACICVCVCLISKIAGLSVNINAEYKAFVGGCSLSGWLVSVRCCWLNSYILSWRLEVAMPTECRCCRVFR